MPADREPDAVQALTNLLEAVELQNDTIRKLADSVRILNNRVERLEREAAGGR